MKQLKINAILKFGIVLSFFLGASNFLNAQNCFGATAPDMEFGSSSSSLQRTIQLPSGCSGGAWSIDGAPSWLTSASISGTTVYATAPAYSGTERSGTINLYRNGSISGGIKVWQNKGNTPPPPPPPACVISGFTGDNSLDPQGETKTFTLSYTNCPSSVYYTFKELVNYTTEQDLPNWVTNITQNPTTKQISIQFLANTESISRDIHIIGKRQDGGTPGIQAIFSQACIQKTWYADSDGDGFRDPGSQPETDCANRSLTQWTQNTTVDNCPDQKSTTNNGCDSDCANGSVIPDGPYSESGTPSGIVAFTIPSSGGSTNAKIDFPTGVCSPNYSISISGTIPSGFTVPTPAPNTNVINISATAFNTAGGSKSANLNLILNPGNHNVGSIYISQNGPPLPCVVSGDLTHSFNANGEIKTFPLNYSNCSSQDTFTFTQQDGSSLPTWIIPRKSGPDEIELELLPNNSVATRPTVYIIGTGVNNSSLGIGGQITQPCIQKTWYADSDGDGFRDPGSQPELDCANRDLNLWTENTTEDQCPTVTFNTNLGCPTPCSFDISSANFNQDALQQGAYVLDFPELGGNASITLNNYANGCVSPRTITVANKPDWITVQEPITGNIIYFQVAQNTEEDVYGQMQILVNGEGAKTVNLHQDGPPVTPSPTTCQAYPVSNVNLSALGDSKTVTIEFVNSNNCSGPYYLEHPYDPDADLSWLTISPASYTNGNVLFTLSAGPNNSENQETAPLALFKDDGTGTGNTVPTGGVYFTVTQVTCLTAWYPDTDGDGFGDVYGNCYIGCNPPSDPYLNWVDNNIDLCPKKEGSLENKGCPVGEIPENQNSILSKSFDINETLKSAAKGYYDQLGRSIQRQTWGLKTNDTWASQTMYDEAGRPVLETLEAPIREGLDFVFNPDFVKKSNSTLNYDLMDFTEDKVEVPNEVGIEENTLGWYYSNSNNREQYQDVTQYPFSKSVYSKLNPGATLRIVGGNKVDTDNNGQVNNLDRWAQSYSFKMIASNELVDFSTLTSTPYDLIQIVKTVSRDIHGVENVLFADVSGKVLGSARSGAEGIESNEMDLFIGESGYVDVHIPAGIIGFTVSAPSSVTVYNLITEQTEDSGTQNLTNGFYRVLINDLELYESNSIYVRYKVNYYDFSLNQYDDADRLVASYQPLDQLKTSYKYNSLNQLIKTESPEGGISRFIYREDGQVRFSQNEEQANANEVSYTNYDHLGRPIESGVMIGENYDNLNADSSIGTNIKEKLITSYDAIPSDDMTLQGLSEAFNTPTFLSGRVARTKSDMSTTFYSYDIYGRVKWIVQDIVDIGVKTIEYKYEPITGFTTEVDFQRESPDERFIHKYEFNNADELYEVYTSTDGQIFNLQARYFYYETGDIKRMEIANGAQGVDYVYNMNGQLKGINHPDLVGTKDPGGDSNDLFGMQIDYHNNDYNRQVGNIQSTEYGTDRLNGNIKGIRWNNKRFENNPTSVYSYQYNRNNWLTEAKFGTYGENLDASLEDNKFDNGVYDNNSGNVKIEGKTSVTLQNGFHAELGSDVTIRIVPGEGFDDDNNGDYNVTGITYDSNGNIKTLNRNTKTEDGENTMDQLTYNYYQGTESDLNTGTPNQLQRVEDGVTRETSPKDIKSQSGNNYQYNTIGQLISNEEEGISYIYNASGLVTQISKNDVPLVRFFYNDRNHRVKKESYTDGIIQQRTHYVPDVSGHVLAVYNSISNGAPTIEEHPIYGASRIGIFKRPGLAVYQLTDHLGNVRATFGANLSGAPVGESFNDYYPFGMLMNGRNSIDATSYRYAFQGQEKDIETDKEAFELRLWDSRIGRWLTTDPAGQYSSPYLGMGNNPINGTDSDGGFFNPVFGSDGTYLGNTKEGFVGLPIIYDGYVPFDKVSAEDLTGAQFGGTYLDWDFNASSRDKIEAYIVNYKTDDGLNIDDYIVKIQSVRGVGYNYDATGVTTDDLTIRRGTNLNGRSVADEHFEPTVENLRSLINGHEVTAHVILDIGGGDEHYGIHSDQVQTPQFKKTTDKFKTHVLSQFGYHAYFARRVDEFHSNKTFWNLFKQYGKEKLKKDNRDIYDDGYAKYFKN